MARYQSGCAESAEALVEAANPILARFLYATSWPGANLDDLLQECWLRVHKARSSYRPGEPALPWLIAIARHTRVDSFRRWQRTRGRESGLGDRDFPAASSDPYPAAFASSQLMRLVASLPEAQREVIVMLKLGGLSVQEVALATGSTTGAVKQKAYRAYQTIRARLGAAAPPSLKEPPE
jgi:RNA polymerase sigma-70 factor (ECF subfamily)